MNLTRADLEAINKGDDNYLLDKGDKFYDNNDFKNALEYYYLASAMGNIIAIVHLGYFNLLGRCGKADVNKAIGYFQIAANKKDVEACYALGKIYGSDKWKVRDDEMCVYFYQKAASIMIGSEYLDEMAIAFTRELTDYPGLCHRLALELMPGGLLRTNIMQAYELLEHAEFGYAKNLSKGQKEYEEAYDEVLDLIEDPIFDEIRDEMDELFNEDCLDDEREYN